MKITTQKYEINLGKGVVCEIKVLIPSLRVFYEFYYWIPIARKDILQHEIISEQKKDENLHKANEWLGRFRVKEKKIYGR